MTLAVITALAWWAIIHLPEPLNGSMAALLTLALVPAVVLRRR